MAMPADPIAAKRVAALKDVLGRIGSGAARVAVR
jgi:hypothetical protein